MKVVILILSFVLSLVSLPFVSNAMEEDIPYKEGELIIKYKTSDTSQNVLNLVSDSIGFRHLKDQLEVKHQVQVIRSFEWANLHHVKLLPFDDMDHMISELQKMPEIEYVEPNYILQLGIGVDALELAPAAQRESESESVGASGIGISDGVEVIVAVIDTGVAYDHPDIAPHMWSNAKEIPANGIDDDGNGYVDDVMGWDFVNGDADPYDDHYHGTHVSGIVLGLQEKTDRILKIMPLKFLSAGGWGSTGDAILAIDYAVRNGAKVLNNSWGGGGFSYALRDAIVASYNANTVFVAAAGNSSVNIDDWPTYPPSYLIPNEISVAALDSGDNLTWFSNYGPNGVHVGAPGQSIYSTLPKEQCNVPPCYGYLSGTSMAAPYVSGMAAMMLAQNPDLMHLQVKQIIMETSVSNASLQGYIGQGSVSPNDAYVTAANTEADSDIPPYDPTSIPGSIGLTEDQMAGMGCAAIMDLSNGQGPSSGSGFPFFFLDWPLLFFFLLIRVLRHRREKFVFHKF